MEEVKLSPLEKRNFERGLATARVRLKAGRIIWDELEKKLGTGTGDEKKDAEHLLTFKQEVDKRRYYEQLALIEWLEAQIDSYPDVLGAGSPELSKTMKIYVEHLNALKPPKNEGEEEDKVVSGVYVADIIDGIPYSD